MQTYLKTKPVWMQLLMFLAIAFGLFLIAEGIGLWVLSKITGINPLVLQDSRNWDVNNPKMMLFLRGLILIQFLFLFLIPSAVFAFFSDSKPFRYLGFKAPGRAVYWVWGILLIAFSIPFVEYIGLVNQKLAAAGGGEGWMKEMEEEASRQIQFMLKEHNTTELVKNLVFVALFAGIGEELFFRGILQRMFIRSTRSPWAGIIIAAIIFSGIHFQFYGFLPRLFLGILLGAIYWYSGSLWVAILAHFLYDATIVLVIYFNPHLLANTEATLLGLNGFGFFLAGMASLAVTFVILHQMQQKSVTSFEEIYNDDFPTKKDDLSF